jgi:hypothetical protein
MPFLVLLKNGVFVIEKCGRTDSRAVAKRHDAGICGMFGTRPKAKAFIQSVDYPLKKPGTFCSFP